MLHVTLTKNSFHSFFGMDIHVQCTVHVPEHQRETQYFNKKVHVWSIVLARGKWVQTKETSWRERLRLCILGH